MAPPLARSLQPCGPVVDARAAGRAREMLAEAAADGWTPLLDEAWQALAPVFAASPYLTSLARLSPERLRRILAEAPEARLQALLAVAKAAGGDAADGGAHLRRAKGDLHLLAALADLGGVWSLDHVTSALARFADVAVAAALAIATSEARERGRLATVEADPAAGPLPGLFVIAMGKHGAFELNYSSDIDISVFYEPDALPVAEGVEPQAAAVQLTQRVAQLLQERTGEGYVFRVDLRLRPDPSATPVAMPVDAALEYYETVGQNWERAAYIKARACAGDIPRAEAFLEELKPFIWRRYLDYAAIADIHSIKRQIHLHKTDERLSAPGHNLKLGAGGIREIEFYVQTQQLILGGRDPSLRQRRTLDALQALEAAGQVTPDAARDMATAYGRLRAWEHRVQMLGDEQTHKLPEADEARGRVAALSGARTLRSFDAGVEKTLKTVNRRYGELFPEEEALASRFGSLVFTGVEDDPETLQTLARMGFSDPGRVSQTIRAWHHGRISATRSERSRELFTRLAPRLLDAAAATGAPNEAFNRFVDFFSGLASGVQVQSLLLAEPRLLELLVKVLAHAPALARTLAQRPAVLDALLDPGFFAPLKAEDVRVVEEAAAGAAGFEDAMDAVRRTHREQAFRVGVQVMSGAASAEAAGAAFAELADACIRALAPASLAEVERLAGTFPGELAVIALGKCGSREMTARSDLDLMTLYRAESPAAASAAKGWSAETFFGRFTQRLVAALSAPTAEGGLYEVDLQLRPSGTSGPVAVSFPAFERYYDRSAETWELLALTRARVAWASSPAFGEAAGEAIAAALRRPRDRRAVARDVLDMRALMERERPPSGFWDLKLAPGGLVDIEFAAQFLQIVHAGSDGPLQPHTAAALQALETGRLVSGANAKVLIEAWTLQQNLSQLLKLALPDNADPDSEPKGFRQALAKAGASRDFPGLRRKLERSRGQARAAFVSILNSRGPNPGVER